MPVYKNYRKATGAELDALTDDAKFLTAKAVQDGKNVPHVAPGTTGNMMKSDGTNWTSAANNADTVTTNANLTGVITSSGNATSVGVLPYMFRAYRNAALNSSAAGDFVTFALDAESFDIGSNFSGNTFTAPVTGYYRFDWGTQLAASAASKIVLSILCVGGTEKSRSNRSLSPGGGTFGTHGSDLLYLSATNTVTLKVYESEVAAYNVGSATCFLSGFLVSL